MALSTYAELQASIASWINRSDLTATIPDFIAMAEARFNREVRHWRMERTAATTISSKFTTLPADWVQTVTLSVTTGEGPVFLSPMGQADMAQRRYANADAAGVPRFFNNVAGQFEVFPSPDGSYSAALHYIEEIPALSDDNTSNWLLEKHPDAYLYTALTHSAPFMGEDERTATWAAFAKASIDAVNAESNRSKGSAGMRIGLKGLS